jgi:hypothetical protein
LKRRNIFSESPSRQRLDFTFGHPVNHSCARRPWRATGDGGRRSGRTRSQVPSSPSPSGASRVRCEPTALTSAALRSHPPRPAPHKGCPLVTKAKIPFPSRPTKPRTGNAKAPALDPDDYRDEVLVRDRPAVAGAGPRCAHRPDGPAPPTAVGEGRGCRGDDPHRRRAPADPRAVEKSGGRA